MAQKEKRSNARKRDIEKRGSMTELGEYIRKAGFKNNKEFSLVTGISQPLVSDIANKKILPTVPMLRYICTALNIVPLQIYSRAEIDLVNALKERGKRRRIKRYRVEASLGRRNYNRLIKALRAKGYTQQAWICEKALIEIAEYEKAHPRIEAEAEVKE